MSETEIQVDQIRPGTAYQLIGANSGATKNVYLTLSGTVNQVDVSAAGTTLTLSTPLTSSLSYTFPSSRGTSGYFLQTDGSTANLVWAAGGVTSIHSDANSNITGAVQLVSGTNITLSQTGQAITVNATGSGSGTVNSGTQYQLGYYAANGTTISGLTLIIPARVLVSDANGLPIASSVNTTTLGFLDATSSIQTQINGKLTSTLASGDIFVGNGSNVATAVALSGDATLSNAGALTLATVNSNVGSFTNAKITVNAKGLITAASAGTIGEYVEAVVAAVAGAATSAYQDVTTISLTAGDWECTLQLTLVNSTTGANNLDMGISIGTAGNAFSDRVPGSNAFTNTNGVTAISNSMSVSGYRLSLSGTTTVRAKFSMSYSAGSYVTYARLSAWRMK